MIKRLFIICLMFTCCEMARAQSENKAAAKSDKEIKIYHLQNQLPYLKDTARINCLNSIAYLFSSSFEYHDYDSVSIYALPSLAESRKLNYRKGIMEALMALGNSEPITNNAEAEKHLKELISMTDDDSIIAFAQFRLAWCLLNQAKFDEAIKVGTICSEYFKKINNLPTLTAVIFGLSTNYSAMGNYEKAFEYNQDALQKSNITKDKINSIRSRLLMADFYMDVGLYETAKKYINDASQFVTAKMIPKEKGTPVPSGLGRGYLNHLGELYFHLKQFDSALYYYRYVGKGYEGYISISYKLNIAKVFLAQKEYDKALPLLEFSRHVSARIHHQGMFMRSLLGLSECYLHKKDFNLSIRYANQALSLAQKSGAKLVIRDAYLLLTTINEKLGRMNESLDYHKKYMLLKDSIMNDQYKGKLFAFKQNAEEELRFSELRKQKENSEQKVKIQQHQISQSRLLKNGLIGCVFLILLLGYIILHNISLKRKNERLQYQQMQAELKHKASDLEMQALRAQMNPHFIFNCLSSINRFILTNETEAASDYLTRFSRLIRLVLIHSQSSLILLKDELEMLRYYLDMEQLRFNNSFDYTITFSNSIDPEIMLIPPLLLQPFCENAIWHGLMHQEGKGHLEIILNRQDNLLHCEIRDNGVGRAKAAEFKSKSGEKQKSMGLKLTSERLALINEETGAKTSYEMEDILENGEVAGTKVNLFIRYKDRVSEPKKELSYQS